MMTLAVCRGAFALGSACLMCVRCEDEAARLGFKLRVLREFRRCRVGQALVEIARTFALPPVHPQHLMCDP